MTSVWAGTYRLPPGMSKPVDTRDWSAIHEVLLSEPYGGRRSRLKKYPSPAADEIFHPGSDVLKPLVEQKLNDVRSYVFELICSEVFLVTFPGNLFPLARLRRELLRKFGANVGGKTIKDLVNADVMADVAEFAQLTSITENIGMRRTILLVPAMTSRCADYSVLGQAAFLSSGITTVFCNAVCASYGHGQSCFIGHDSWLDHKKPAGLPSTSPYHGAEPGIFHLDQWNRGRLGKNEQALVIADIDPIYGPEGKPRPQTLLDPLKLIAHLPVIEAWEHKPGASPSDCRCNRTKQSSISSKFTVSLHSAIKFGIESKWKTTMNDTRPSELAKALDLLAECAGTDETSRGWLTQRSKAYLAHHLADPNPWPPPVALDWLWVETGSINPDNHPEIETPPYAAPPGGEQRQE